MIECPKCKSEIDNDSRFCDQCGLELRFCSLCGRPGKGNRCTSCGGVMVDGQTHFHSQEEGGAVNPRERTLADAITMATKRGIPHLFLVNENMHARLAGVDGAILGRRQGIYQSYLSSCSYVSGTHAQLEYNAMQGWMLTDRNSSNGTKVNGKTLVPGVPCALRNGARVLLANVEFVAEIV